MLALINKSYPSFKGTAELLKFALGVIVFLFLFIIIYKPFELHNFEFSKLLYLTGMYCSASFFSIWALAILSKFYFPNFLYKNNWKIKDEIIFIFMILSVVIIAIILVNVFFNNAEFTPQNLFFLLLKVLAVTIIPTFVVSVIKYQNYLSKILDKKELLQKPVNEELVNSKAIKIHNPHLLSDLNNTEFINLASKNKTNIVRIRNFQFLFAKSDGNYIDVFYLNGDKVTSETIRTPLKELLIQLEPFDNLIQCHRTYIVNIKQIELINGNSRSAVAKLKFGTKEIPISRSYFRKCKALFDTDLA